MVRDYLKYLWNAKNEHSIHSPFVFEFYLDVIKNGQEIPDKAQIESLFEQLKKDERLIKIKDLGAGSKFGNHDQKKVSRIASTAVKSLKWSKIVAGIVKKYDYKRCLELGTSLGFTAAMMSKATPYGKVYSFEGCSNTLGIAKEVFSALHCKNVTPILGDIDQTLSHTLEQMDRVDFVFFDANHQCAPTLKYFRACLQKAHENSCFVFDDINWSADMKEAWSQIKQHEDVSISIDLFQMGIVFFRKKQPKQHYILRA